MEKGFLLSFEKEMLRENKTETFPFFFFGQKTIDTRVHEKHSVVVV